MLKKRIIFTLLYDSGHFMLSRNFRLQRVGDQAWLKRHYDFSSIAFFIDELIVLDVSRATRDVGVFSDALKAVADGAFVPVAAGGGVRSVDDAARLLRSGADKIVINTPLVAQPALSRELAAEFGQQCVVGAVDVKRDHDAYRVYVSSGECLVEGTAESVLSRVLEQPIGEVYLNSIDRDGTGQGYDCRTLDLLPRDCTTPVIMAGGVGNARHLSEGLADSRVAAVATAHLFNFVGDGLQSARSALDAAGHRLAHWPSRRDVELN